MPVLILEGSYERQNGAGVAELAKGFGGGSTCLAVGYLELMDQRVYGWFVELCQRLNRGGPNTPVVIC